MNSTINFSEIEFSTSASFNQEGLWFLQKISPETNAYNFCIAVKMTGELNINIFKKSLFSLVDRHEVLRTCFKEENQGELLQVILAAKKEVVDLMDLSNVSTLQAEEKLKKIIYEESKYVFNLATDYLFRFKIVRFSEQEHFFVATIHHIIFDEWSQSIFLKELSILYNSYLKNENVSLRELSIQYADFSIWDKESYESGEFNEQILYWKEKLAGNIPILEVPSDFKRPLVQPQEGSTYSFQLNEDALQKLKKLGQGQSATLYMVMLSIYKVLIYKYTGENDLVIGSPTARRNIEGVENLIGFFVNILPLRTELNSESTFESYLLQVRDTCLKGLRNQDIPFDKIVQEIKPYRSKGYNPLVQLMFTFHNVEREELNFHGIKSELLKINRDKTKYDLVLQVEECDGGIDLFFEYSTDLYSEEFIKQLSRHYTYLIDQIIENPKATIGSLNILSKEDIEKVTFYKQSNEDLFKQDNFLLSKDMQLVPLGVPGELFVKKSSKLLPEFEEKNFFSTFENVGLETFFGRLYGTGEIMKRTVQGDLVHICNKSSLVKYKGFTIDLSLIEKEIMKYHFVKYCKVSLVNHNDQQELISYIIIQDLLPIKDLAKNLKRNLPRYMVPTKFIRLE
ncbi:hypothetical protein E8M24_24595 [Bacillus thuringiensis]|uniref:condensation domain-containing protein n=1 Tax=Bacillus thuringiensis TaxID=1428 RepID=UPI00125F10A1|nr:condensation domain-containing protein [Bacillus thuringiensis]KAB5636922.1 hypothetical protein E8M24_24595 [Bacillus thuringiensis]